MALIDPPAFLGLAGNEYPAARFRRVHQLLLGGREGCLGPTDMVVTETNTPGLSVSVAAGAAIVNGDDAPRQGAYVVENDAAVTVGPITTPHSTLPRVDRLVLEVLDQEGTGSGGGGRGSDLPRFRIVAGTPSSSPAPPAEPPTAITLALINVSAGASAITNAAITDWRPACNPNAGPTGTTGFTALATPPWGALLLNGAAFDGARWPALAAALGSTTLPDARGRALIGTGQGSGLTNRTLGAQIGAESMPAHTHERGSLSVGYAGFHSHGVWYSNIAVAAGTGNVRSVAVLQDFPSGNDGVMETVPAHTHALHGTTATAGAGNHGVMQPSLVQTPFIWA